MPKNKKIFAICFFALQILIVAGFIVYSAVFTLFLEKYGKEYRMKADSSIYVTNGVCYFDLKSDFWYSNEKFYVVPDEQTGEYRISSDYYAPKVAVDYINSRNLNSFPWEREYQLKNAPSEPTYYFFEQENTFVTVKIFKGKCKVTDVECDGIPIEEYLATQEDYLKTESLF